MGVVTGIATSICVIWTILASVFDQIRFVETVFVAADGSVHIFTVFAGITLVLISGTEQFGHFIEATVAVRTVAADFAIFE